MYDSSYPPRKTYGGNKEEKSSATKTRYKSYKRVYKPSVAVLKFWDTYFKDYDEVSICDYLDNLLPILEKELEHKLDQEQLKSFITTLNYEKTYKISKMESNFYLDKIWNNPKHQATILYKKFIPIEAKMNDFLNKRQKIKDEIARLNLTSFGNYDHPDFKGPTKLKDYLTPLDLLQVPSNRNNMFILNGYMTELSKYLYIN